MKFFLLALIASSSSFADFVFMQEGPNQKSIQMVNSQSQTTVNDSNFGEWALYPDISSDGKLIVYAEGRGPSNLHLTLKDKSDDSQVRFHHPNPGLIIHPKLSKNGRWIFYSAPREDGRNTIYYFDHKFVVESHGNFVIDYFMTPQELVPDEVAFFPRPSSDAGFVVYQRNTNEKKEIVFYDRIEGNKKVLAEGMSPALSFDERYVAYTSKQNGNWDIFQIDRFTGKIEQLTHDENDEMAPTYTPEGKLVFASNQNQSFRLFELQSNKVWKEVVSDERIELSHYSAQFSGETRFEQSELPDYLGNNRSSFGTVMHNGILYMAGGHEGREHTYPPESFSDKFFAFNPVTKFWIELAPRPHTAHGYQIAAFGNYIYAFGGFAYSPDHKPRWKSLAFIDRYDIKANKWQTIGELISPRSSNVAVTIDEKVYLLAGWDATPQKENDVEGRFHSKVEIFDLRTEKILKAEWNMPLPLRRALTGIEYDGKILLIGGLGVGASHFELISNVTAIDPMTGAATELAHLPFATFAPAAGVIGNELFVFGGMFKTGSMNFEYVSHIYGMDLTKNEWRHTGRYLKETKGFSQVFNLTPKKLGILGGHHYEKEVDEPVKTFETFK